MNFSFLHSHFGFYDENLDVQDYTAQQVSTEELHATALTHFHVRHNLTISLPCYNYSFTKMMHLV